LGGRESFREKQLELFFVGFNLSTVPGLKGEVGASLEGGMRAVAKKHGKTGGEKCLSSPCCVCYREERMRGRKDKTNGGRESYGLALSLRLELAIEVTLKLEWCPTQTARGLKHPPT